MNQVLDKVEKTLRDVYETYKDQGLEAVYLHGSILSEDFTPGVSDVDAVAICNDETLLEVETSINAEIKARHPGIKHFTVRLLYKGELNGGEVRGYLAKYIDPALLLFDFPNWRLVAGKGFERNDFDLGQMTIEEVVCVRVRQIKRKISSLKDDEDNFKYLIKAVARLCYLLQGTTEPFSYSGIRRNINNETRVMVDLILEIKNNDWDRQTFDENLDLIKDFVGRVGAEYEC